MGDSIQCDASVIPLRAAHREVVDAGWDIVPHDRHIAIITETNKAFFPVIQFA